MPSERRCCQTRSSIAAASSCAASACHPLLRTAVDNSADGPPWAPDRAEELARIKAAHIHTELVEDEQQNILYLFAQRHLFIEDRTTPSSQQNPLQPLSPFG